MQNKALQRSDSYNVALLTSSEKATLKINKIIDNHYFRLLVVLIVADLMFFGLVNPAKTPSYNLIVGFLLFTITAYVMVGALFRLAVWYGIAKADRQKYFSRIITGGVAGIVALQSIGQLYSRDVLVLTPLAILIYMYLSYRNNKGRKITEPTAS